jgi:hypothetical protein
VNASCWDEDSPPWALVDAMELYPCIFKLMKVAIQEKVSLQMKNIFARQDLEFGAHIGTKAVCVLRTRNMPCCVSFLILGYKAGISHDIDGIT